MIYEAGALTYQDLRSCASKRKEIEDIVRFVTDIRKKLESGRVSIISHTPRGRGNAQDKLSELVAELVDAERRFGERVLEYFEQIRRVEIAVALIWKAEIRRIMRLKYLMGYTWETISEMTNYDERWCRELNKRGLRMMGIERERETEAAEKKGA